VTGESDVAPVAGVEVATIAARESADVVRVARYIEGVNRPLRHWRDDVGKRNYAYQFVMPLVDEMETAYELGTLPPSRTLVMSDGDVIASIDDIGPHATAYGERARGNLLITAAEGVTVIDRDAIHRGYYRARPQ